MSSLSGIKLCVCVFVCERVLRIEKAKRGVFNVLKLFPNEKGKGQ